MTAPRLTHRTELQAHQFARLHRLLAAVLPTNRFYAAKWAQAGVPTQFDSLDAFFKLAPFTLKSELSADQAAHPPFGSNLTFPVQAYTRFSQTSASTGTPLRWLDTADGWQWMLDNWREVFTTAGVQAHDRVLFTFSFGPFLGFWTAFEAAAQLGCLCLPGGGMSSISRLRMLLDNQVTVLCCTPTYALRLSEVARAEGIALTDCSLRRIIVAGEPGGAIAETRARIQAAWPKVQLFDHHGMTEVGPVSVQNAPDELRLRVFEHAYLAEVLDPATQQPVADGGLGELVLTTLGREGSPLIRYRTGDLVRPFRPADATATLLLDGGILGRVDDMAIVRGVNVFPSAIESLVRRLPEIAEYRVTLETRNQLTEIRLEIEPTDRTVDAPRLVERMEQALRAALNLRVPVSAVTSGTLPRFELKAKRWIIRPAPLTPGPE